MASAWLFQKPTDVAELGEGKAPFYVGWYELDGRRRAKSFGVGLPARKNAERFRYRLEDGLTNGTYQSATRKVWEEFVEEYDRRILAGLAGRTREGALIALAHFKRLANPAKVLGIDTRLVDDYIAARRQEPSKVRAGTVSPATVNKEMRHVKAALNVAAEWGYLAKVPKFRMEKVPYKLPGYVTPEHFAALYSGCEEFARRPEGIPNVAPADWWRGLLMTAYMTGWRIGSLLALRWDDVDLDAQTAVSHAADNKGKRDALIRLHAVVVDHLRRLKAFDAYVFPWPHNRRQLFEEFNRLQLAAKVKASGPRGRYGFHDLRRAFATMNADRMTADALQHLMQHRDYQTTQRYIAFARQMDTAVANLYVPEVAQRAMVT